MPVHLPDLGRDDLTQMRVEQAFLGQPLDRSPFAFGALPFGSLRNG